MQSAGTPGSESPEAPDPGQDPWWLKLVEPFRSEAAAFRVLLAVVVICATVAAIALLVRALT